MTPTKAAVAVAFVLGASVGAVGMAGMTSSSTPHGCREALAYAVAHIELSAAFAENMADFLAATAASDQAKVDASMVQLGPIHARTDRTLDEFLRAAADC